MAVVKLGLGSRQQVENKETRPTVAVQSMEWNQGLSDGEEGNILEMESGQMVSSPGFAMNEHLSTEPTPQRF